MSLPMPITLALLVLTGGTAARAQAPGVIDLILVKPPSCSAAVYVSVHANARQFDGAEPPVAQAAFAPTASPCPEVRVSLRGVPPGSYAIRAYQDLNGNGRLDRPMIGPPSEPWAVSNNLRFSFRAPRFEEARITVAPEGPPIPLLLR